MVAALLALAATAVQTNGSQSVSPPSDHGVDPMVIVPLLLLALAAAVVWLL